MIKTSLEQVAREAGGELVGEGSAEIESVSISTLCPADLFVAVKVEFFEILIIALNLEAQARGKILFVANHDIDILSYFLVHFLSLCLTADCAPH